MRKILLTLILSFSLVLLFASNGFDVNYSEPASGTHQLEFTLENYELGNINLDGVDYTKILFDGSVTTMKQGFAELPFINASVRISNTKNVTVQIIEGEYEEYQLDFPMLPSRGVIYRNQDPATIPYEISSSSLRNMWYPQNIAENTDPFIMKDIRGTSIYVYPFRYNAVQNVLRVYKTVTVQLIENETTPVNPLLSKSNKVVREMDGIYNSIFVNYNETKDDLTIGEFGDILVVTTDRDETAIQPYIEWKREKGYNVSMEIVATNTNVTSLIQDAYDANNNLLYVQLVGDWPDIKSNLLSGYAPMDPQLGCVVGTDEVADISIGRFSANSPSDVTVQVDKIIEFERNPEVGGTWYKGALGIGSNEGASNGDDGEVDKEHEQVIWDDKLDPFTFDDYYTAYDPGANVSHVNTALTAGVSVINYTGHGYPQGWSTSGFSNSNVSGLSNGSHLPWLVSVACNNGDFHGSGDCFAEAWQKKSGGGSVMFLGATISQPWQPPMRGQDYFMDILVGGYDYSAHPGQNGISTTEQRTTLGTIVFNGLALMTAESGGSSDWETAKTWHLFGDPSMQVRTDTPGAISLSTDVVMAGIDFTTTVSGPDGPFEGAMVCISNGTDYFSALTDATGSVTINHTLTPGSAKMVVTGFNLETIYEDIVVASSNQAWIVVDDCVVDDAAGNNNGQADYGETVSLNVAIENVGSLPASGVEATISTDDSYITINTDNHYYGDLAAGQVMTGDGAFSITVAEDAPDGYNAIINVEFADEDSKELWEGTMTIMLHAPVMDMATYTIVDPQGNGNGKIDPGETVQITIDVMNDGSADAMNVAAALICADPYITITQSSMTYGDITAGEMASQTYEVTADPVTPTGYGVTFNVDISADMGIVAQASFIEVVGHIPVLVIDMDGNNSSAAAMLTAMEDNGVIAEYSTSIPADLELYSSVFLCLGIYSDNHVLTSAEGQQFAAYLNQGGNLYMEGGDTWAFDASTAVHSMFNLTGDDDGSGDMGTVIGMTGTFTEGMSFSYSGNNNYMDHLIATSPAFIILKNQAPNYGTAVAYDEGSYKTIGTSHEFGGMDDAASPSTKAELMAGYLEFFGIGGQTLLAYFAADQTEICFMNEISFADYSTGEITSYSWEFEGGTPATSTEQNPTVLYETPGTYDVSLTVSNGDDSNTYTQSDYIIVNTCTDINEVEDMEVAIYPNPTSGSFFIEMNLSQENDITIQVVNSIGEVVMEKTISGVSGFYRTNLDINQMNNGLYFIVVNSNDGRTTQRIILK
jgi:PKD repeat protein